MTDRDARYTMPLEEAVAYAALRSLHSHFVDAFGQQTTDAAQMVFDFLGQDMSFDVWHRNTVEPDGCFRLVRFPGGTPGVDVYELRWRDRQNGREHPYMQVQGQRLGLVGAVLPAFDVEIDDRLLGEWISGAPGGNDANGGVE